HRLVDSPVGLEGEAAANPGAVGLVPDDPVPVAHRLSPLLQTTPNDVAATLREPAEGPRIVERPAEFGEGDHRHGANVEHRLYIFGERLPFLDRVGRAFVIEEDADDIRAQPAQPFLDAPAVRPSGEVPPAVRLVQPVAQPQTRLVPRSAAPGF